MNTQVLGISVDHVPCLQAWAESLGGINYPLLSDFWPHGEVATMYGVLRSEGYTERTIVVIDKDGIIRYIDIHDINDRPDNEEVRKVLRQLEAEDWSQASLSNAAQTATAAAAAAEAAEAAEATAKADETAAAAGVYFEEPAEAEIPQSEITLYCATWCKDCKKARAWLDERGLKYVEVDIDYNKAARIQVRQWGNGFLITPVIQVGDTIVVDFNVPKLEEALNKLNRA